MEVTLLEKNRFRRTFAVQFDDDPEEHFVEYHGDGMGHESVWIDGAEAVRESGVTGMVPRFEFSIGAHDLIMEIQASFWLNALGPMYWGGLKRFAFYIDDQLVYADGKGIDR
jgi:hypothetical protein